MIFNILLNLAGYKKNFRYNNNFTILEIQDSGNWFPVTYMILPCGMHLDRAAIVSIIKTKISHN